MLQCFTSEVPDHSIQAVAKQGLLSAKVVNSLEEIVAVAEDSMGWYHTMEQYALPKQLLWLTVG